MEIVATNKETVSKDYNVVGEYIVVVDEYNDVEHMGAKEEQQILPLVEEKMVD